MDLNKKHLQRSLLASSIAAVVTGVMSLSAHAQDESTVVEEVVVTGIRQSLENAMDIKRDASGVVDAISAEDMGKFPDSNLAESLQRITGVSIDRNNGEGSRVTVRGFGPDFNLVTLNGRQMPGAILGGTSAPSTRSFDFSNISADAISGVDIYKTGRADNWSGGIGSTINIKTARPLDLDPLVANFQTKGIMDTSNENGDDITPEVSGMFSTTFADGKFGVLVSASYSQRDSQEQRAVVSGWLANRGLGATEGIGEQIENNNQNPDGNTWAPRNIKYDLADHSRTRTNGQVVLQFAPTEAIDVTLDYTASEFEDIIDRSQFGVWFNHGTDTASGIINENGTLVQLSDAAGSYDTFGYLDGAVNENESTGLNVTWQASDSLELSFDAHSSSATAEGGPNGNNSLVISSILFNRANGEGKVFDLRNSDIGSLTVNGLDNLSPDRHVGNIAIANGSTYETTVDQAKFDGVWSNESDDALKAIKFGLAYTDYSTRTTFSNQLYSLGFTGDGSFSDASLFEQTNTTLLDAFSGSIPASYYRFSAREYLDAAAQTQFGQNQLPEVASFGALADGFSVGGIDSDHRVSEETESAYLQFDFETEFNGMPIRTLAGIRWERTNVNAQSLQLNPVAMIQTSATEFITLNEQGADGNQVSSFTDIDTDGYDLFLPSLDVSVDITDDLVSRFSYSQTASRSDLSRMRGEFSITGTPKPGARTGSIGNPDLKPYLSNNIDLSLEYYFGDSSYVSGGFYLKDVTNFVVLNQVSQSVNGITDPTRGPRADAARAALTAAGSAIDSQTLYNQMVADTGNGQIRGLPEDELATFLLTKPENGNQATVNGLELAVQHVWDSGFGFQANMTTVSGDVEFNREIVETQFVIPGLSDSYNIVGFYEKNGFQGRIAYNWRDEFLSSMGQEEGGALEPQHTEAYGQIDMSVSYDFTDNFTVFLDAINIADESQRVFGRYPEQLVTATQFGPRYTLGFRGSF